MICKGVLTPQQKYSPPPSQKTKKKPETPPSRKIFQVRALLEFFDPLLPPASGLRAF